MFRQKQKTILPTNTQTITVRPGLQPIESETPAKSTLTAAATYLSSTWQWLCGARWDYVVSIHDFSTITPEHIVIGCYSTQAAAEEARENALETRKGRGGRRIWRRSEEIQNEDYGTLVEDRDNRKCDIMALVEKMRVG